MSISLYIHIPWCIRKCPYCDFNSHKSPEELAEKAYVKSLLEDFNCDLQRFPAQSLTTIFIGGGTPSLFSAQAYADLLQGIDKLLPFSNDIEITLEANPGTYEQQRFVDYRAVGINRLSLGIQSFNAEKLKQLGRIHDDTQAKHAITSARRAGFTTINLDLMHGLPNQTVEEGIDDLRKAISFEPEHLSWYQLTIEPNTLFYKAPPVLPNEDSCIAIEEQGLLLLDKHHYQRYEISAFCHSAHVARHNVNYWLFGDYYGIGAGAHGKLTVEQPNSYVRTRKYKQPVDYLNPEKPYMAELHQLNHQELLFEFMLNTTRLEQAIPYALFTERTGLDFSLLKPLLLQAEAKGLLDLQDTYWQITPFGRRFTNDLQALFLLDQENII